MSAAITDDGVARLRRRIGVARPHSAPPHYLSPNEDAFRHVAMAYGDDNPLWCDPAYGASTRWGGPIAPPHLVGGDTLIGEDEVTRLEGEVRDLMKGDPLGGVHAFYSGRSASGGTRCAPARGCSAATRWWACTTRSATSPGAPCTSGSARCSPAADGPVLSGQYRLMIRAEREKATERAPERRCRRSGRTPTSRSQPSTRRSPASRHAAAAPSPAGGRTSGGRRDRPARQGADAGDRHGGVAHGHGHGAVRGPGPRPRLPAATADAPLLQAGRPQRPRRAAAGALGPRVGPARPATPPATTTGACARPG